MADKYDFRNYNFTDADKANLAYVAQRLLNSPFMDGVDLTTSYINPISGEFDRAYGASYPIMDDRAINNTINALLNRYQPAINARRDINNSPRAYRDFYTNMFNYR